LIAAATLFFLAAGYPSNAGDLEFNSDFELPATLKGSIKAGNLTPFKLAPHSVSPWVAQPLRSIDSDAGIESDDAALVNFDFQKALHPDPDHCPTCIINPLNPMRGDEPINVVPESEAGLQPGLSNDFALRALVAAGGNDSELLGCNLKNGVLQKKAGQKLAQFSWRQFPEVVRLSIKQPGTDGSEGCTGTIVGANWVLTAAHCITAKDSARHASNDLGLSEDQDFVFSPPLSDEALQATAVNSALSDVDKVRFADRAVVNKLYDKGLAGNSHDVALLHFETPFDRSEFPEAALATKFDSVATLAGYGVSNTKEPLGAFFVTFPPLLAQDGEHLTFTPGTKKGAFCQGDSGGPVFTGLNRGCKPGDAFNEPRPRSVQGIISFKFGPEEKSLAVSCLDATSMSSEDVTNAEIRSWICATSGNEVNGCTTELAGESK
jgi:hypothetical protein